MTNPLIIAVGANLLAPTGASPLATCRAAVETLRGLSGLRVEGVSRWYATAPVPASEQPDYVNGIAVLSGEVDPATLLGWLQAIERGAGRERAETNAARVLDLDIVAMGALVRETPDPILPHPRMHERAFVLRPMIDLALQWRHPKLKRSAAELLHALSPQDVRVL